jgi:aminopeptidase-like protein
MKIGQVEIPGETTEEVLLFAHLDHPYQANDNLSGVACLIDIAKRIKTKYTIKIVFCPETIGSIAYAHTQDLSKVKFAIAVDICGNDKPILLLKAFEPQAWINRVAHCAFQMAAKPYRKAPFRSTIGSDETVFNDPAIGIPSLLLTTHPYDEYHTDQDTPEKINYEKITEVADMVMKIIEVAEKDFIPERLFKGQLRRSKFNIQSSVPQVNLNLDYLFYSLNGKSTLAELCADFELNFDTIHETIKKIEAAGYIRCLDIGKRALVPAS